MFLKVYRTYCGNYFRIKKLTGLISALLLNGLMVAGS